MAVVSLKEILDPAFAERYGVAAINIVDDLSLGAVLDAAVELDSPVIIQTSLKTVKSIGANVLEKMVHARADEVPVPVALHLDHCPEREWVSTCLAAGWSSVLFDGSHLDVAENTVQTAEVVSEAREFGADVEGEIESVLGVEDGVGSDVARPLQGLARAQARAGERARRAASDSDGAPRWHRAERGAVHRPDRARVRQGQHLDRAEDRIHRFPS
jgi:fructose/tagatose bisphosphate aldolase